MVIEKALSKDVPELCSMLAELFAQEREFDANPEYQAKGLSTIIGNSDAGTILVARESGKIIGMVSLLYTVSTALGGRVAILEDMFVLKTYRDKGVGGRLMKQARQLAEKAGCKRITLLTDHDNYPAHRFYTKHGFEKSSMIVFRLLLGSTGA